MKPVASRFAKRLIAELLFADHAASAAPQFAVDAIIVEPMTTLDDLHPLLPIVCRLAAYRAFSSKWSRAHDEVEKILV